MQEAYERPIEFVSQYQGEYKSVRDRSVPEWEPHVQKTPLIFRHGPLHPFVRPHRARA